MNCKKGATHLFLSLSLSLYLYLSFKLTEKFFSVSGSERAKILQNGQTFIQSFVNAFKAEKMGDVSTTKKSITELDKE